MFARRPSDEQTGENPDANAVIQEIATVLASDTTLRTEQWVAFSVIAWMGHGGPHVSVYRYDDRGEPFFVEYDKDKLAELVQRLQAATEGEGGELWRAAVLQYVERTGNLTGRFLYGEDADAFAPDDTDGERTYQVAVDARPADD